MPEEFYIRDFPKLGPQFRRTSEPAYYNCIAYVVHDYHRMWWPGEYHPDWSDDYWPSGVPQVATVQAFALALATVGYLPCTDDKLEPEFEKAALYALQSGEVAHAARQESTGAWRSKLGLDEDIEHPLAGLEGPAYGRVVAFFKRPRR